VADESREHTQDHLQDEDEAIPAAVAARGAVKYVADFTGREPETVVALDSDADGWTVGVEVLESRRIPDTTDILAIYEVRLDRGGRLRSYRRTRRYTRGQLNGRDR
jgi:hypothetical protein